jgi:hypothetical protein
MTRKDAAASAPKADDSPLPAEQLTISFAIPDGPSTAAASETGPAASERLVARVRAGLRKRLAADERSAMGFVCAVCAEPATGWTRIDGIADGKPVIDGYATCLAHRSRETVEQLLVTRVG